MESAKEAYQSQFMDSFNGFCEVQQEMQFIIEDETREADEYLHLAQEREKEVEANLKRVRDTRARMNKRVRTWIIANDNLVDKANAYLHMVAPISLLHLLNSNRAVFYCILTWT